MTESTNEVRAVSGSWDSDALVERLTQGERGGTVYHVRGVAPSAVQRDAAELRSRLAEKDRLLVTLDGTGGPADGKSFREATLAYARTLRQRGRVDDHPEELVDFLASGRDPHGDPHRSELGDRGFKNAICRVWSALSETLPAVLFVFHGSELGSRERETLRHFAGEFFVDPVADIAPGLSETSQVASSLVFVGSVPESIRDEQALDIEEVDVADTARETIREQLTDDSVVEQFVASTGGDPEQLGRVLETLPDDYESFWTLRCERLDAADRRLLELLAVAGEPVPLEWLRHAYGSLEIDADCSARLQRLVDEGFVERRIEASSVEVRLPDGAVRRGLREELESSRRAILHGVLADAAAETPMCEPSDEFLADHLLAAGEIERGFEYGMRAGRKLHGQYAFREARELFESLVPHAPSTSDERRIRNYLLDIHIALGNPEEALDHLGVLEEATDASDRLSRLACRKGNILAQAGAYDEADEAFGRAREAAGDDAPVVEASALFGRAESRYMQGRHGEAGDLVDDVLSRLEELLEGDAERPELERTHVQAKNLKGRLAIFHGELERAQEIFESNYTVASKRGWDRERNRAEGNLAVIDLGRGDYASALETLRELESRNPGPEGTQRALLLTNLGAAAQHERKYGASLEHFRDALREARRADYDYGIGLAAHNLAIVLESLGAYDECLALLDRLEESQLEDERTPFAKGASEALRANVHIQRGDPEAALEQLDGIDETASEVGKETRANVRLRTALAHAEAGELERAATILDDYEAPDDPAPRYGLAGLEELVRARLQLAHERFEEAERLAEQAETALRDDNLFQDSVWASLIRVRAMLELGRGDDAESLVEQCLVEYRDRAGAVPAAYRDRFFSIPAYERLVTCSRELLGEVPEEYHQYCEISEDAGEASDSDERPLEEEAYRRWRSKYSEIIGEDERLIKVFRRIEQFAESDSPVLIQGESGTGKELVADAIHREGRGAEDEPFVKVNCGAFVDNLLLSELFGHEKGAFTGAVEQKAGRFERADGGTIFLDEVGEMSEKAQVALLRVLQEGEFERVGGTETYEVDVRVICATNRDLEQAVENGQFRLDLYYRLKGVLLELPALRDRRQDIPRLVRHFAAEHRPSGESVECDRDVMEFLASYSWPGNVRELKNFVRSILLFVDGETVDMEHLRDFQDFFSEGEVELEAPDLDYEVPAETFEAIDAAAESAPVEDPEEALVEEIVSDGRDLSELKERIEYESIRQALRETGGNITQAADILKMTRPRLSQIVNSDDDLVELKEELVG